MKKIYLTIMILTVLLMLSACADTTVLAKIELEGPQILYVGDIYILEPQSTIENDQFTFKSSNNAVAVIDINGILSVYGVGEVTITVTNKQDVSLKHKIDCIPIPDVESIELSIENQTDDAYYVGKDYILKHQFLPYRSSSNDIRYSYSANFMSFNEATGEVKFYKAGHFQITAYLASDWNIQTTYTFDVSYDDAYESYNILFIGNSLTRYTYNIPMFIHQMLLSDDVPVFITVDSTTPQWIIDHELSFNHLITKDQYTHVFLQEQSMGPISDFQKFEDAVIKFDQKIKLNGARTMLYQTWGYNYEDTNKRDEMTINLGLAYEAVADKIDATISPVGYAFLYVSQNYPEINLYNDLNHPSIYGALLSAYTHYATLTNRLAKDNLWQHESIDADTMAKLKFAADYVVHNR